MRKEFKAILLALLALLALAGAAFAAGTATALTADADVTITLKSDNPLVTGTSAVAKVVMTAGTGALAVKKTDDSAVEGTFSIDSGVLKFTPTSSETNNDDTDAATAL
ncbi:MAG: hypothetical protein IJ576_07800, partial [Synergistaceae bacterium]|nr:hypothetical protein [Synergistaceae bacterium]